MKEKQSKPKDLEFFKSKNLPGPTFSTAEEVDLYMNDNEADSFKTTTTIQSPHRMYGHEVYSCLAHHICR